MDLREIKNEVKREIEAELELYQEKINSNTKELELLKTYKGLVEFLNFRNSES